MTVYKRWKGQKISASHSKYKQAKWTCEFFLDGKTYKKSCDDAKNKNQAEEFEANYKRSLKDGNSMSFLDSTNFSEFIDDVYLPYVHNNNIGIAQKISETNKLKAFFGSYRLKAITPALIEQFKTKRSKENIRCQKCLYGKKHQCEKKPLAPATVNHELATLSKLLEIAWINGLIEENPMRKVRKLTPAPARQRFLTSIERERLLSVLQEDQQLLSIVLIAILTGWRKGQILALQKSSLDETTQSVMLIRSKQTDIRKVPVAGVVWQILKKLSEETENFLFINKMTGKQLLNFDKTWLNALRKAEINGLRFHDLRRTFAVEMLNVKADSFEIQKALGHSNIETTKIYAQVQNEKLKESLEKLTDGVNFQNFAIIRPSNELEN